MESNQLTIEIEDPHVEFDEKSGMYSAFFDQFPQASAVGQSKEEAQRYLLELLPVLFAENPREMMEIVFEKYVTEAQKKRLIANLITNDDRKLLRLATC